MEHPELLREKEKQGAIGLESGDMQPMEHGEELLRLLRKQEHHPFFAAIDGRCASGKTTLAGKIQAAVQCNVIHMDDFYLPFSQRTEERMSQPGGNMDFDRLLSEVLLPLKKGINVTYRPYDCHGDRFLPIQRLDAAVPTIVEGSYSCHPRLEGNYDLRVFLNISPETQRIRLLNRNPAAYEMFRTLWIPREEQYFAAYQVKSHCDLVLWGE